jgi:hypothetical protein
MYVDMTQIGSPASLGTAQKAHDLGGIALNDGVRWNRPQHGGPSAHPGTLADSNILANNTGSIQAGVCSDNDPVSSEDDSSTDTNAILDNRGCRQDAIFGDQAFDTHLICPHSSLMPGSKLSISREYSACSRRFPKARR